MNESDSNPKHESTIQEEIVIHVRDRRKPKQYIVDNLIMDEYFPLIGPLGYSVYSQLVRMSNERSGEQARASLRMLCAHLGIKSRAVLGYYISLLEITGLVFKDLPEVIVQQGKKKVKKKLGNRSNTYYILDVKPVSPERLKAIKTAVKTNQSFSDSYRALFLEKIENWRPVQALWRPKGDSKIKTVVGQSELPLAFEDEKEEVGDAAESLATLQNAEPVSLEILRRLEITKPSLLQELGQHKPSDILGMVFYGLTQSWMEEERLSGYIIKNLGEDGAKAPEGFYQLAKFWLSANTENREALSNAYLYGDHPKGLAEDMGISVNAAKAALRLSKRYSNDNHFQNWLSI